MDPKRFGQRSARVREQIGFLGKPSHTQLLSVTPTGEVRKFASQFGKSEAEMQRMVRAIKKTIPLVRVKPNYAEGHYGIQTAHDIFKYREIPVLYHNGEPTWGCHQQIVALCACLAAKKISYKYVRTILRWENNTEGPSHSVALFQIGKKFFVSDLFLKGTPMQQVGEGLREQIGLLKKLGKWREANSPEQLGIHFFEDMDKYNPDTPKK